MARLNKLLKQGVPLFVELQGLTSMPIKLSAKGSFDMATIIAGSSEENIAGLNKLLIEKSEEYRYSNQFVRNSIKWIKEKTFTMPTKDIRRYTWLAGPNYDAVIAELASLQSFIYELIAVAIYRVTQSNPEVFGTIDDINYYHARVNELNKELDQICKDIESGYSRTDLQFSDINSDGYAKVSFKISNGEVPVAEGCGRRLIEWTARNKQILES
jgi:hypothetical protein